MTSNNKKKKKYKPDAATRAANRALVREVEQRSGYNPNGGNTGQGGDDTRTGLVHGTDAQGKDVTASFGRPGTNAGDQGDALLSDDHKSAADFYGSKGNKGHDHYNGRGGGTQRGQYTGEGS